MMINLNNFFALFVFLLGLGIGLSASAEDMLDMGFARLRTLDKITARTVTYEAQVGSTVSFGNVFIKVQACRQSSPLEHPESAAFLQVWEGVEDTDSEWVFSGWMFSSSPGLSHMDHPVYDVWVLDCFDRASGDDESVEDHSHETSQGDDGEDLLQDDVIDSETAGNPQ